MKIEIPWRAVAGIAFVVSFICLGGVGTMIWHINRLVDHQNVYTQVLMATKQDVQELGREVGTLHRVFDMYKKHPSQHWSDYETTAQHTP